MAIGMGSAEAGRRGREPRCGPVHAGHEAVAPSRSAGARIYCVMFIPISLVLTLIVAMRLVDVLGWWTLAVVPLTLATLGSVLYVREPGFIKKVWLGWMPMAVLANAAGGLGLFFLIMRAVPIF